MSKLQGKLKDKLFVISMTKMATTHTQEILHTLYPEKKIGVFNAVDYKVYNRKGERSHAHNLMDKNKSYWSRRHITGLGAFEYFGYAARLRLGDDTFLDEADIFVDSFDEEVLWGDNILSQFNPETTLVLNRNLREWLISQFTFFYKTDSYSYNQLVHKFFHKNRLYARLAKYNFETINVTTESLDQRVREFYVGNERLPDPVEDELYALSHSPSNVSTRKSKYAQLRAIGEPFIDEMLKSLKITEEEQNLPFIPRLL